MPQNLGFDVELPLAFNQAVGRVKDALKQEGFGILTEIDLQAAFREKLGREFRPYVILGACNPVFAQRALQIDPSVSLLLPCNVVVEAVVALAGEGLGDPGAGAGDPDGRGADQVAAQADDGLPFTGFAAIPLVVGGIVMLLSGRALHRRAS